MSSFIAPQATTVAAFRVAGIAVRTTNAAEADPASARIGPLWDRFFSESWQHKLPPPGADGRVFGVYSGYASDQHGAFDVTAGVAAPANHQALQGATTVDIEAGTYQVFEAEGQMPQLGLCCTSRKADEITPAPDAAMPWHPRAPCSGARVA